jgi:tRNA threonylcarbamoyladenosine biosynthesis protein TsaE
MLSLVLSSPADTRRLGRVLAQTLTPPALVLLRGDLGTGKTTLVRQVARAAGVTEPVVSPSFTIAQTYSARRGTVVNHLDLYRLQAGADVDLFSWDDYLTPDALTFVEWPESGLEALPPADLSIELSHRTLTSRGARLSAGRELERALRERLHAEGLDAGRAARDAGPAGGESRAASGSDG